MRRWCRLPAGCVKVEMEGYNGSEEMAGSEKDKTEQHAIECCGGCCMCRRFIVEAKLSMVARITMVVDFIWPWRG